MRILYVTTTFPVYSETFLQREVRALRRQGAELRIVSLHGGEAEFEGMPVERFRKRRLWKLLYLLPWWAWRRGEALAGIVSEMARRRPASGLNLLENLLGFGAALVEARERAQWRPEATHCVWASAPAAYGMALAALSGIPFSMGAHAYDVFEHGGDWLLPVKAGKACLVHVSTEAAGCRMRRLCRPEKVALIRRGLSALPEWRAPRERIERLRIVCVARLVEKKGILPYQLEIYGRLKAAGLPFEAEIIGDGPLEAAIRAEIRKRGLEKEVRLVGRVSEAEVMARLAWADALFHTGVVAKSGDRDGLPNVVPEAMAVGAVALGSPVSGVAEAIADGETGFICPPWEPAAWVERCKRLMAEPDLRQRLAVAARRWVEGAFVAEMNTGRLLERLRAATSQDGRARADSPAHLGEQSVF